MCLWTGRSQCDFKVVQHVWMRRDFYIRLWKPLCTLSALQWTFIVATVTSCLTTSMLCISMHTELYRNITKNKHWEIVRLKETVHRKCRHLLRWSTEKNKMNFIAKGH